MLKVADSARDFLFALKLWTTTKPYCDFPCATINWRLAPAFFNKRLIILSSNDKPVGFVVWAWMTDQEFTTRKYSGATVFARERSDRLVICDAIITADVARLSRELRTFYRAAYPGVDRVHVHRGPRDGFYCI